MRISKIKISNIMGIEELELTDLGNLTEIEGLNGQGKSSALAAIRSVIDGGHDATLLRQGAEAGEVVILLEDETLIRERVTAEGTTRTVKHPELGTIGASQAFIRSLFDELNPADFLLERDEARRTERFLEALPLELDREAVRAAVGEELELEDAELAGHPLKVLERIRGLIFERRRDVNRSGREKEASIKQLSASLPPAEELEADPIAELAELEQARERSPDITAAEIAEANTRAGQLEAERVAPIEERIRLLRERMELLEADAKQKRTEIEEERLAAERNAREAERIRNLEIRMRLDTLRAGELERARTANTREVIATFTAERDAFLERSRKLSSSIEALEGMKSGLLAAMPMKGITIEEGVIHRNGIPWPRINRADQVKIAIQLATLRKKKVPLVCVDNIECLDGPTLAIFRENAAKAGLHFIVTKVSQDPEARDPGLKVRSHTAAAPSSSSEEAPS